MFRQILYILLLVCCTFQVTGQNTQVEFGQNRVQYKNLSWQYFKGDRLDCYFYLGGQEIGMFVAKQAQGILEDLEQTYQYEISKKISILIFTDQNDIYQTNLGYRTGVAGEQYSNIGSAKIVKGKLFVYFTGSHQDILNQLRKGFMSIIINEMMHGTDIAESIQNSMNLYFPDWFTEGLIQYETFGFEGESLNHLNQLLLHKRYDNFLKIANEDAELAGQSFWYFIEKKYGGQMINTFLYMARVNRNLEYTFLYLLGKSSKEVFEDYIRFYQKGLAPYQSTSNDIPLDTLFKKRFKKRFDYYNVRINDDGTKIAYVRNYLGRYHVRVYDLEKKRRKTILKGGYRSFSKISDKSFPLLDWAPNTNKLTVLFENRDEIYFKHFDFDEKTKELVWLNKFQKVHQFSYGNNDQYIYMSASKKGQSDLYRMHIETQSLTPLTQDVFDDIDPIFVRTDKLNGLFFLSNRPYDETIKEEHINWKDFNICYYDFNTKKNRIAKLTEDGMGNIKDLDYHNGKLYYLSKENGIYNHFEGQLDTVFVKYDSIFYFADSLAINPSNHQKLFKNQKKYKVEDVELLEIKRPTLLTKPISQYNTSISDQDENAKQHVYFLREKKRMRLGISNKYVFTEDIEAKPFLFIKEKQPKKEEKTVEKKPKKISEYSFVHEYEYYYTPRVEKKDPKSKEEIAKSLELKRKKLKYNRGKILAYRPTMILEYANYMLDNATLFTLYTLSGSNTALSPMYRASVADLFEDFRFQGGIKSNFAFNDKEIFLSFEDNKKRLDKRYLAYRRGFILPDENQGNTQIARTNRHLTELAEAQIRWPFSELSSIRASLTARRDRIYQRSTEFSRLIYDDSKAFNYVNYGRLEYVFDNSVMLGQGLPLGTRFKVFYEYQVFLNDLEQRTNIVGMDFRFHNRIHKIITFNNRLAMGQSFGKALISYELGGVDGWLYPQRDVGILRTQTYNFVYTTPVTHLRGYNTNFRNGNKYFIFNSEIRVPIVKYLNLPWHKEFLQRLTFIGFGDVGTTWVGLSPFTDDNSFKTEIYNDGEFDPVTVIVNYEVDPILRSLGWGVRSKIMGYFVRAEFAYPYHNAKFHDPVWQLSTVIDF